MIDLPPESGYDLSTLPPSRPASLTMIALFQFSKASFLILIAAVSWLGYAGTLTYIPNLKDLLFIASHGKDPHGIMLVVFGSYAAAIGNGIWKLRRWARNSLVFTSLCMLVLWLVHHDFDTSIPTMPGIARVRNQTVYLLLLFDFVIFMYLKFHHETARCFPPKKRRGRAA